MIKLDTELVAGLWQEEWVADAVVMSEGLRGV